MQLIKIMPKKKKKNSCNSEKGEREPDIEWLWKENWTSVINTALMFSHTLLLPNREIVNDKTTNTHK